MPAGSGTAAAEAPRARPALRKAWFTRATGLMMIAYGVFGPEPQPELLVTGAAVLGLDQVMVPNDRSPEAGSDRVRGF